MEQIDFKQTIERLKDTGFSPVPNTVEISIPDAKKVLWAGIKYFTEENARWLPEYEEVASWLAGNGGRVMLRQLWSWKNIDLWKDSSSGPESLLPEGGQLLRCTADER